MTLLNRLAQTLERGFTNAGRSRARTYLLRLSDRTLADAGFSRELLEQGNRAWPWRVEGDSTFAPARSAPAASAIVTGAPIPVLAPAAAPGTASAATEAQAIAELKRLDDAELADLGIARHDIAEAVRHGRPGIDREAA